jgi:acyl-CoA synthetase (AMP-forming)/AMP-acid ligase II/acyl carrier protein
MLLFPSGLDFVTAFFGCLFAGVIPVPAYPPSLAKRERSLAKLHAIAQDCGARFALTTPESLSALEAVAPPGVRCLTTDACDAELGASWQMPEISRETVAIVQYTSGSTGAPKGAVVRHRQLLANELSIEAAMGPVKLVVGWLPVFHDMGLIGNVLQGLFAGSSLVLMSPFMFLKRPARWLEAISHFRATASGGPNFPYDLCVRRVSEEERARLDLSSWEVAYCGAEPVRAATCERFSLRFESRGFSRSAFFPCYGLAEATLFVAGSRRGKGPKICAFRSSALDRGDVVVATSGAASAGTATAADDLRVLISCGKPSRSEEIRIVDPERLAPTDGVGEVWVRGPAIASGYWGRDDDAIFGARLVDGDGPFLRTGDLGFLYDAELYIIGRRKDMIIIAGRNLFPQDIEATVEAAAPSVRKGCCVAFSVEHEDEERLVIMAENDGPSSSEVVRTIKQAVVEHHQAPVFDVVLTKKGAIMKTSSGKLERYACRQVYAQRRYAPTEKQIRDRLLHEVASAANMPIDGVDIREPFASYGLASVEAVHLVGVLETWLGLTLDATLLWDYSTIEALARLLAERVGAK